MGKTNTRAIATLAQPLILLMTIALMPSPTRAQFYTEDFDDWSASDFDNGFCEVRWCDATDLSTSVSCSPSVSLRMINSSDDVILWVHFGDKGCTGVRIDFNYTQWESSPAMPDMSDAQLRFATSTSDTLSCYTSVSGTAALLNRTYSITPTCYSATHTINLESYHRSAYWKFDKGTFPTALFIDDIAVTLIGCECAAGACVTELEEDFGTFFQSGTVCELFPDTFESCAGNGPYISSGTACGGSGDYLMTFGSGYPYSEATLRCIDLAGVGAASLEFNYTKTTSTLGPYLYASLNGEDWTNIWSAPFSFGGGCVAECVDLEDYVGEAEVWVKFSSGTSGSQAHGIDDLLLVRGTACPATEACCFDDGSCTDLTPADCGTQGGTAQGAGSDCGSTTCPQPEACCFNNGSCQDLPAASCTSQGGTPQGSGTDCGSTTCPVLEACCFNDGSCQDLTATDCANQGGTAYGLGAECATTTCPVLEACCFSDGACDDLTTADCATQGGTPQGTGSECATTQCPQPPEACCFPNGACGDLAPADCTTFGGTPQGTGSTCATAACTQPEACCFSDGSCGDLQPTQCTALGGDPQGNGSECATTTCPITCTCPGDMNGDGLINGDDIQLFVEALLYIRVCP